MLCICAYVRVCACQSFGLSVSLFVACVVQFLFVLSGFVVVFVVGFICCCLWRKGELSF